MPYEFEDPDAVLKRRGLYDAGSGPRTCCTSCADTNLPGNNRGYRARIRGVALGTVLVFTAIIALLIFAGGVFTVEEEVLAEEKEGKKHMVGDVPPPDSAAAALFEGGGVDATLSGGVGARTLTIEGEEATVAGADASSRRGAGPAGDVAATSCGDAHRGYASGGDALRVRQQKGVWFVRGATLQSCCTACFNTTGCAAAVWSAPQRKCWLKAAVRVHPSGGTGPEAASTWLIEMANGQVSKQQLSSEAILLGRGAAAAVRQGWRPASEFQAEGMDLEHLQRVLVHHLLRDSSNSGEAGLSENDIAALTLVEIVVKVEALPAAEGDGGGGNVGP